MGENSTILSQFNAHSSLQALVEEVDGALYLYLDGPKFGVPYGVDPEEWIPTRSVWVANTDRATSCTKEEYEAAWKEGKECALPTEFLSKSMMPIDTSKFEFIWSPQGDSVALMQENELLAFIPSSASNNWGECRGYSSYLGVDECYGMLGFSDMGEYLQIRNHFLGLKSFWQGLCRESNWRQFQSSCLEPTKAIMGRRLNMQRSTRMSFCLKR